MPPTTPIESATLRATALLCLLAVLVSARRRPGAGAGGRRAPFTLEDVLSFPYAYPAAAAAGADRIAWKVFERGARNLWSAAAPGFEPVQLTAYTEDDGQNLGDLQLTPDGATLIYTRGNGPNRAGEHANPSSDPKGAESALWAVATDGGGAPRRLAGGHGAALSPDGARLLFLRSGGKVYEIDLGGGARRRASATNRRPERELARRCRGRGEGRREAARALRGPLRRRLAHLVARRAQVAFASDRGDHSFVGVYDREAETITWMAPSVDRDGFPTWSPDGTRIAFIRFPGRRTGERFDLTGGTRFSLWIADAATGEGAELWTSPPDRPGPVASPSTTRPRRSPGSAAGRRRRRSSSPPSTPAGSTFTRSPRRPPVRRRGRGRAVDLTPGDCEAEASAVTPDGATLICPATAATSPAATSGACPPRAAPARAVTLGDGIETDPVVLAGGTLLAFRHATARRPQEMIVARLDGTEPRSLGPELPPRSRSTRWSCPRRSRSPPPTASSSTPSSSCRRRAPPAEATTAAARHPLPPRRPDPPDAPGLPLLGLLRPRLRHEPVPGEPRLRRPGPQLPLGIGYGSAFRRAPGQGPRGATEYRDVLAAGLYLRRRADVDPERIGLWGGSYGGYLTALGARPRLRPVRRRRRSPRGPRLGAASPRVLARRRLGPLRRPAGRRRSPPRRWRTCRPGLAGAADPRRRRQERPVRPDHRPGAAAAGSGGAGRGPGLPGRGARIPPPRELAPPTAPRRASSTGTCEGSPGGRRPAL